MNCKNCDTALRTDFAYCPGCGGKVVEKRLTFTGLWADIYERFLNIDSTIFRTLRDMTLRPQWVIHAYVDGVRRKYMNPLNYFGLSLFLSGFLFYCLKKFALEQIDFDIFGLEVQNQVSAKVMDAVMEYSSFIYMLYIPIIALSGFLTLNSKRYNLPEYLVASVYALSHLSILTFLPVMAVIVFNPQAYMEVSLWMIPAMLVFPVYVFLRTHPLPVLPAIGRSLLYMLLFLIGYFGLSIAINLILFLTGDLNIDDFKPPKA